MGSLDATLAGASVSGVGTSGGGAGTVATTFDGATVDAQATVLITAVAEVGSFEVQFVATFASGASPAKTFKEAWEVKGGFSVA